MPLDLSGGAPPFPTCNLRDLEWGPARIEWQLDPATDCSSWRLLLRRDCELDIISAFRQFHVVGVVRHHLASVRPRRKWFFQRVGRAINTLVDEVVLGLRIR
jgi:hypothetical protein